MNAPPRSLLALPLLLLLIVSLGQASAESLGEWTATTSYPIHVAGDSCATYSNDVYCVGGFDDNGNDYDDVYYAQLSPSGVGSWSAATPFPNRVDSVACFTGTAAIYCVGGENAAGVFSKVYTAPISGSGLGQWSSAAAYPNPIAGASCVASSGYVYCVGGFNMLGEGSSSTYYASISSGLTTWMSTTPYPLSVYAVPCVSESDFIYCVAGQQENTVGGTGANTDFPTAQVYYAPLSSSGIGTWSASSAYPQALSSPSCVASSGEAYCLGGYGITQQSNSSAYSSAVSSSGVGAWAPATPYPLPFDLSSCVSDFSNIYCIGGRSYTASGLSVLSSDYYAALAPSGFTSTSASTTSASSSASASTSNSASSTSSTAPEFPTAAALPLVLAACLLVVAALAPRRFSRSSGG